MANLQDKTLLIISQNYAFFIKNQIECIAPSFKHIYVLPVYRPIAEISNILPIDALKPFRKKVKIDLSNLPENITVIPIPLNYLPTKNWYRKVGDLHTKAVSKTIDRFGIDFDLIHCHFTYSSGYVGMKLKEKFQVPLLITAHGFDIYDLPFRDTFWQERIRVILEKADRIITVSQKNRDCMDKLKIKTPVNLITNGFQPDLFFPLDTQKARNKLNLANDRKILVTVGNLIEIKGHKFLIEVIKNILPSYGNLLCFIIGSGGLKKFLKNRIKDLKLEQNVILLGEKDHAEINDWINCGDIFVLPSLNEGNPTVLFECLGCGKPFVGSRVGGVPEIIDDEKLGLLFAPGDIKDMEKVLQQALKTDWDREYISRKSKQFTWNELAQKITTVYKQVCQDGQVV